MIQYRDDYGNMATIESKKKLPYKGSKKRKAAYYLSCYAEWDDCDMYFRSVYSTLAEAKRKLQAFSCGTFKEV